MNTLATGNYRHKIVFTLDVLSERTEKNANEISSEKTERPPGEEKDKL